METSNKIVSLGDRFLTNSGEWCEVIGILPNSRVEVGWDSDGGTSVHFRGNLKKGEARNPNFKLYDIEGKKFFNRRGERYKVIEYKNTLDILIEWESGAKERVRYDYIELGSLRDPKNKFRGLGTADRRYEGDLGVYRSWDRMIKRCTGVWDLPSYAGVEIEEYLLTYSNFYKIVVDKKGRKEENFHLDKDVLSFRRGQHPPMYSRETIAFIPAEINTFLKRRQSSLHQGVERKGKKYAAHSKFRGERFRVGGLKTEKVAYKEYCKMKRWQLDVLLTEYKEKMEEEVVMTLEEMNLEEFFAKKESS